MSRSGCWELGAREFKEMSFWEFQVAGRQLPGLIWFVSYEIRS